MPRTFFARKPTNLKQLQSDSAELRYSFSSRGELYYVAEERELSNQEWVVFTENLLEYQGWISAFSGRNYPNGEDGIPCLRVTTPGSEIALIIDTQGYDYARYVGIEESSEIESGSSESDGCEEDDDGWDDEPEPLTEEEVVDGLRALLAGDSLDCTMLDNCRTRTYADGGYMTYDQGFVIETPDGHRFQITVKQEC